MNKITVTIQCTAKELEVANFLLGQAFQSAKENEAFQRLWSVNRSELERAEQFRLKLLEQYLKL